MVLCNRCQPSEVMRPCILRDGGPCLVCKEDMELEQKIQELQDRRRILRTRVNASHDPFHFKFPPEIASLIFSLSVTWLEHQPNFYTSRILPTPFLLGSVNRRWRQLARSTPQLSLKSMTGYNYQAAYHYPSTFSTKGPNLPSKKYMIPSSTPSISIQDVGAKYSTLSHNA